MTIHTVDAYLIFDGDGIEDTFTFDFPCHNPDWMKGLIDRESQVVIVELNSDQNNNPGGTVQFFAGPPAEGTEVIIVRLVDFLQFLDYQPYSKFPSSAHEFGLDKLTMITQQLAYALFLIEGGDGTPGLYVLKTGDTMIGQLNVLPNPDGGAAGALNAVSRDWVLEQVEGDGPLFVLKSGDTMEGQLEVLEPDGPADAAPRDWILGSIGDKADADTEIVTDTITHLLITDPELANDVTINTRTNVGEGLAALNEFAILDPEYLPPLMGGIFNFLGVHDASTDTLPPDADETGDAYIISVAGILMLYSYAIPGSQTAIPVVPTDLIAWIDGDNPQGLNEGWWYMPLNQLPRAASTVTVIDDDWPPAVTPAADVQETFDNLFDVATGIGTAAFEDIQEAPDDVTEGRILTVGAFGLGNSGIDIPFDDLNEIEVSGFYNVQLGTDNAPTGADLAGSTVINTTFDEGICQQLFFNATIIARIWVRAKYNNAWGGWKELGEGGEGGDQFVLRSGDIMEGPLQVVDPTGPADAVGRDFVLDSIGDKADATIEITTNDDNHLTIDFPTLADDVNIDARVNVGDGLVAMNEFAIIDPEYLPPLMGGIFNFLGIWDASGNLLPDDGEATGDAYIISEPGTLQLYTYSVPGSQTPIAVVPTDLIAWIHGDNPQGLNEGWWYMPLNQLPRAASTVTVDDTGWPPAITPAADVQETFDNLFDVATGVGTAAFEDVQTTPDDITPDAVLQVGSFGLGGEGLEISSDDANDIVVTGFYQTSVSTNNLPIEANGAGSNLLHLNFDSGIAQQMFFNNSLVSRSWIRAKIAIGVYGDWKEVGEGGGGVEPGTYVLKAGDIMEGALGVIEPFGPGDAVSRDFVEDSIGDVPSVATQIITDEDDHLTILDPTLADDITINIRNNVASGVVTLNEFSLIDPEFLPPLAGGIFNFLGLWDAMAGVLPPDADETGDAYLISVAGTLLLYTYTSPETPVSTDVIPTDLIAWIAADNEQGLPEGWWYMPFTKIPRMADSIFVDDTGWPFAAGDVQETFDILFETAQGFGTAAFADLQETPDDDEEGKVLTVGAFGLGGDAGVDIPNDDIDDIVVSGYFNVMNTTDNAPPDVILQGSMVHHMNYDSLNAHQNYRELRAFDENASTWIRSKRAGAWDEWVETGGGEGGNGDDTFENININDSIIFHNTEDELNISFILKPNIADSHSLILLGGTDLGLGASIYLYGELDGVNPNQAEFLIGFVPRLSLREDGTFVPNADNEMVHAGWRPSMLPTEGDDALPLTLADRHLNNSINVNSDGNIIIAPGLGLIGDMIQILFFGNGDIGEGAGVNLSWIQGGGIATGTRTIALGSVVTLTKLDGDNWTIWGNGIT